MGATDEEWDAPSPVAHLGRRQRQVQHVADDGGRHDGHLLTPGLPRDVEALIARCGHLGEIDGDAAELDAGRKPLQEPPDQNQEGGEKTYGLVGGYERDQNRAKRHDAERRNKTLAASDAVNIGAEKDRAERSHQKACAERHEGQHQGRRAHCPSERRPWICSWRRIRTGRSRTSRGSCRSSPAGRWRPLSLLSGCMGPPWRFLRCDWMVAYQPRNGFASGSAQRLSGRACLRDAARSLLTRSAIAFVAAPSTSRQSDAFESVSIVPSISAACTTVPTTITAASAM